MEPDEMQAAAAAPEVMSDEELASMLENLHQQAVGYLNSEVAAEQEVALNYYYGRPFGDERDGRSKVVDLTVAEVCDNAKAAILKPFVSSDTVVEFAPRGPEDEAAAKQATEYVNYILNSDNHGFKILHDAAHDGLVQKLGIAKAYWQDKTQPKREEVTADAAIIEQLAAEIVEGPFETEEPGVFSAVVERPYADGCVKIENIPPEEFRISPYARCLDDAPYLSHTTNKTRSALIEMGFDPEIVDGISKAAPDPFDDTRKLARWGDEDEGGAYSVRETDKSQELIEVAHEFVLIDYNGDGISERREIIRAGNTILFNEEVEDHPFVAWCPVPMPHKVYGRSYADLTMDQQRIRSVLQRQMLDNLYLSNNPRPVVSEQVERADGSTIEDLFNMEPGALIRTRGPGLENFAVAFVADKSFPMLEYSERQIMARTGVSLVGQGLDPDTLKRERTATEASIEDDSRNTRIELVARVFAEDFVKPLFKKVLRLVHKYQPRERVIRLRNQWVPIDPRSWNADMDCTISVGLGVNNKKEQLAAATLALQTMERIAQSPFAQMLLSPQGVYEAVKKMFEAAGFRNVDAFLQEPPPPEQLAQQQGQEPPDPETQKAMMEMQARQAEMQAKQQEAAMKLQLQQQEAQAKLELQREEAQTKLQLEREKAALDAELQRERFQREQELAVMRMNAEMQMAERKMALEAEMAREQAQMRAAAQVESARVSSEPTMGSYRPGGDLDK